MIQKEDYVPAQGDGETEFENYKTCIVFMCFSLFKRLDRVTKSDIQKVSLHERSTPYTFEKRRQLENFIGFCLRRFLFQFCQMENHKLQLKEKFDQFFNKIAVNVPMLLKTNQQFYAIIPKLNWFYVFAACAEEQNAKSVRQFKRAK